MLQLHMKILSYYIIFLYIFLFSCLNWLFPILMTKILASNKDEIYNLCSFSTEEVNLCVYFLKQRMLHGTNLIVLIFQNYFSFDLNQNNSMTL